jgi:radical SAM-linked protein
MQGGAVNELESTRLRILFGEQEPLKYISHLDLLRAWERLFRRAGLPVAYSHGFNPHPKITIAMPLPVGCTGEHEVVDVIMCFSGSTEAGLTTEAVAEALRGAAPQGLVIESISEVPLKAPPMPNLIRKAAYTVVLRGISAWQVEQRVRDLLSQEEIEVEFRHKRFDLGPLIETLDVRALPAQDAGQEVVLEMTLLRDEKGRIGRPDVVLEALGCEQFVKRIHRTQIVFEQPQ